MRIPNTKNVLLWNFLPALACCFLIYFPYFFYSKSELFAINLKYGNFEHAVYGLAPVSIILLATYFGGTKKYAFDPSSISKIRISHLSTALLWSILAFSLAIQFTQNIIAIPAFLRGGFAEAREMQLFPGIGLLIRLDIFTLPLIAATTGSRKKVLIALAATAFSHLLSAVIMSERTAINEVIFVAWLTLPLLGITGFTTSRLVVAAAGVGIAFSILLSSRLDQQNATGGRFDSSSTTLLESVSAYYADTMNKYYRIKSGEFDYPSTQIMIPIKAILEGKDSANNGYKDLLQDNTSGAVTSALNNPGGLAQDFSDFGYSAFFFIFFKFYAFAYCWFRRYKNLFMISASPFMLISIMEYPRFNYLYMPFAYYAFISAICLGIFLHIRSAKKQMRRGHNWARKAS